MSVSRMTEAVIEEYRKVIEGLAIKSPVLYLFSKNLRVEYHDYNPVEGFGVIFAATDGRKIFLYRPWMELESEFERLLVVVHELYHVFGLHTIRATELFQEYIKEYGSAQQLLMLINMACDAKVNYWVLYEFLKGRTGNATKILKTYNFNTSELQNDSVEELFKKLLDRFDKVFMPAYGGGIGEGDIKSNNGSGKDGDSGGEGGIVIQEGKENVQNAAPEELEDVLKKAIVESILSAKNAGFKLSAVEEAMLNELLENKINWRTLVKQDMISFIRKSVIGTWTRPNRRHEMLMGHREIARPKVYAFVDVSGSVWGDEIIKFMSEVVGLSKEISEMVLVTWDTKVTGEYRIKKQSDLSNVIFRGSGGTEFVPVLENYKGKIKAHDYMIVLTDTFWFDTEEAIKMLKQIRARKVLVRNNRNTDLDGVFNIVLELKGNDGDGI